MRRAPFANSLWCMLGIAPEQYEKKEGGKRGWD